MAVSFHFNNIARAGSAQENFLADILHTGIAVWQSSLSRRETNHMLTEISHVD